MDTPTTTTPLDQLSADTTGLSMLAEATSSHDDAAALMRTPTVNTLEWRIETRFTKGHQLTIKLAPKSKKGKFALTIPAKGTANNKRTEIVFRKNDLEGLSRRFGEYIASEMESACRKWKTVQDMRQWVINKAAWSDRVRNSWIRKSGRRTRMSQLRGQPAAAAGVMFPSKSDKTIDIPVPLIRIKGRVCAIRVYARPANKQGGRRRKTQLLVWIPARLLPKKERKSGKKGLEFSMGVEFGASTIWRDFVVEYLTFAVSRWKKVDDVNCWVTQYRFNFKVFVNVLFRTGAWSVAPVSRPWRLGPSQITPDEEYLKNGWFPKSAGNDVGFGVFCAVAGEHELMWNFDDERIAYVANKAKVKVTKLQKQYQAVSVHDEDSVWVPTMDALRCGVIQECYLVQHRKDDPTHYLDIDEHGRTLLRPRRPAKKGEEFCFNYRLHKSKDDSPPRRRKEADKEVDPEEVVEEGAEKEVDPEEVVEEEADKELDPEEVAEEEADKELDRLLEQAVSADRVPLTPPPVWSDEEMSEEMPPLE